MNIEVDGEGPGGDVLPDIPVSDYRALFMSVPDPCLVLDPNLRIVEVNEAYLRATMTKREEVIGRGMFEVFPDNPEELNATGVRNLKASLHRVLLAHATDTMALQRYDIRRPKEKGGGFEERYWSPVNAPVLVDGKLASIIHRVQDVTAFVKQRASQEQRHAEELNERTRKMEAEIFARAQEVAEANLKLKKANELLEKQRVQLLESNENLLELNGRLEVEVAERNRVQEALNAANAELQRSNKELELFASVTSHDLQEPLISIVNYTDLLFSHCRIQGDPKIEKYARYISDETARMQMLIGDLLAYSRVGTRAKPFAPLSLDSVLDEALRSLSHAITEAKAEIERDQLPVVRGDDVQMAQLFQNLIGNAIKFRKKEFTLHVRISSERRDDMWVIGVHDNGIGIESRYFDRIFQVFRRLHTQQEYKGSGMGLAICKKIIEHHGGQLWVESEPGEGSHFYFTIPAKGEGRDA